MMTDQGFRIVIEAFEELSNQKAVVDYNSLMIKIGGVVYNVAGLVSSCRSAIDEGDDPTLEIRETIADVLSDQQQHCTKLSLESIRSKILPRIQHRKDIISTESSFEFCNDTYISFVLDRPASLRFINPNDIEHMETNVLELLDISIENIHELYLGMDTPVYNQSDDGIESVVISDNSGYSSSMMLSEHFKSDLRQIFEGDFYFLAPCRDLLIGFPERKRELIQQRMNSTKTIKEYPITRDPFFVTLDGIAGTI